jgi:8-oxo-dGTP pyrophosphatase MutT (NUDIX family)
MKDFPESITIDEIKAALLSHREAESAHQKFLPERRSLEIPSSRSGKIRESAILFLLVNHNSEICLGLTLRSLNLKHHPGQISFSGGKINKDEHDTILTALRELEEEIGIDRKNVLICGKLSYLYIPISNFIVYPIVGYVDHEPHFKVNHDEVDEIILLPLKEFFRKENITKSTVETKTGKMEVPCYSIHGQIVWGATAMIISEFVELLKIFFHQKE